MTYKVIGKLNIASCLQRLSLLLTITMGFYHFIYFLKGMKQVCKGATYEELSGTGAKNIEVTTYSGLSEIEKDVSCCMKCNLREDCEYWVRATDSNKCWVKSNDGNPVEKISKSTRRGGLRVGGKRIFCCCSQRNDIIV